MENEREGGGPRSLSACRKGVERREMEKHPPPVMAMTVGVTGA